MAAGELGMVDREARREYAELARHFISGRMSLDEYDDRFANIQHCDKDRALWEVWNFLASLCEDAYPQKMTQQWRLDSDHRRQAAQAILFLQSNREYQWSRKLWDGSVFLVTAFCVLLLFALLPETSLSIRFAMSVPLVAAWQWYEQWQRKRSIIIGDTEAWPFLLQADLAEAARHPRLLNGKKIIP